MNSKWYEKVERDRIDEEDAIMACWNITEEINFLWVQIMDGTPMSNDEICNILLGMQQQYDRKFGALFDTFTQAHGLDGQPIKVRGEDWDDSNWGDEVQECGIHKVTEVCDCD